MPTDYMRDKLFHNQMVLPWGEAETINSGDAAAILQCSLSTVRRLCEEGKLASYQLNPDKPKSPWRIRRSSAEQYGRRLVTRFCLESDSAPSTPPVTRRSVKG